MWADSGHHHRSLLNGDEVSSESQYRWPYLFHWYSWKLGWSIFAGGNFYHLQNGNAWFQYHEYYTNTPQRVRVKGIAKKPRDTWRNNSYHRCNGVLVKTALQSQGSREKGRFEKAWWWMIVWSDNNTMTHGGSLETPWTFHHFSARSS